MSPEITTRIQYFLIQNKLFGRKQNAFKPKLGTMDPTMHLIHLFAKYLPTRNHFSVLSVHFTKAFRELVSKSKTIQKHCNRRFVINVKGHKLIKLALYLIPSKNLHALMKNITNISHIYLFYFEDK